MHVELPSGRRLRSRSLSYPVWHPGDRVRVQLDGPVNVFAAEGPPDRGSSAALPAFGLFAAS